MSHDLELNEDGSAKAFFVGQPAWHGLGVLLQQPPTIAEAIKLAQLDWTVRLQPVYVQHAQPDSQEKLIVEVPSHFATVRESDNRVLGVVGQGFRPLQNSTAFEFFQPFVDSGAVTLEAAGALKGGKRVWVLAKLKESFGGADEVVPGDVVEQYLLLAHGHDGKLSICVGLTSIRVVCQNTLSVSLSSNDGKTSKLLKIRHTGNAPVALSVVQEVINTTRAQFDQSNTAYRLLAATGCDEVLLKKYIREVYQPGAKDDEEACPRLVSQVVDLFNNGTGVKYGKDTLWNALNAVTEHITHKTGQSGASRLDSQWFGNGAKILKRALEVATAISHNPKGF